MKNHITSYSKSTNYFAFVWLICCLLLIILFLSVLPHSKINSSIIALLPKDKIPQISPAIVEGFNQRLERQLIWLIHPPQSEEVDNQTADVIKWFHQQLEKSPYLVNVSHQLADIQQQAWGHFFFENRYNLLDSGSQQRLQSGGNIQSQWILSQLYSPFAGVSSNELVNDPLLLMRSEQLALIQQGGELSLKNGWVTAKDQQGHLWYMLHAELNINSYDIHAATKVVASLQQLNLQAQQRWPGTEILQRGFLYYSDYASQQAMQDITSIGLISALGIISLLLMMFKSLRPLWLILLSLSVGILAGTTAVLMIFGEVHILTLVMSTSVVGISIDYALHYLTERMLHGNRVSPQTSLRILLPTLSLAVFSSCIAYSILLLAPFPGLQQLSVFAIFGLASAFFTVVCWYPLLVNKLQVRYMPKYISYINSWLSLWRNNKKFSISLTLGIVLISGFGIMRLRIDDDISKLQSLPTALQQQEKKVATITGQQNDQKWFIVYGYDAEQTLQRLEQLQPELELAKQNGWLAGYKILPLYSQQRQKENQQLVEQQIDVVISQLQSAGLPVTRPAISKTSVLPQQWLASIASEGWRLLWLTLEDGQTAILVPVNGVNHPEKLKEMVTNRAGYYWMDKHQAFSELFAVYRHNLGQLLILSIACISLLFILKVGVRQGIRCIIPSLLSLMMGLAITGFVGMSINLFSMLALILVLGIGIDYTLFFSNPRGHPATLMLSVFMAALTTLLTFGMLALSNTQAIAGFGLVLSGGIFTAFLLSPLAMNNNERNS